jgi:hypothetical protein
MGNGMHRFGQWRPGNIGTVGGAIAAWAIVAGSLWGLPGAARAQSPAAQAGANPDTEIVTRVYNVLDLIAPKPAYRFRGMYVPGLSGIPAGNVDPMMPPSGGSEGMGAPMGGGMGFMGSGMFSEQERPHQRKTPPEQGNRGKQKRSAPDSAVQSGPDGRGPGEDFDGVIEAIVSTIDPTTWDTVGGPGSIATLQPSMLIISQTAAAHRKIEKLLEDLRAQNPGARTVTIHATWLLLDQQQRDALLGAAGKPTRIDPKALAELAAKTPGYLGAITCFSGQTVHVAAGRSRSAVVGAIPVVGGDAVGYQPIVSNPVSGVVLQVTPVLVPDRQGAIIDVHSVVCSESTTEQTRLPGPEAAEAKGKIDAKPAPAGVGQFTLDRVETVVAQLATTLKVPLNEPTLVGGLTRQSTPDRQDAGANPQLYLFLEIRAGSE